MQYFFDNLKFFTHAGIPIRNLKKYSGSAYFYDNFDG